MAGSDEWRLDPSDLADLGLDPASRLSPRALKTAYLKAATRWHPDHNRGSERAATEHFLKAKAAYEKLLAALESGWDGFLATSSSAAMPRRGSTRHPSEHPAHRARPRPSTSPKNNGAFHGFGQWLDAEKRRAAAKAARERIVIAINGDPRGAAVCLSPLTLLPLFAAVALWAATRDVPSYTTYAAAYHALLLSLLWVALASGTATIMAILVTRFLTHDLSLRFIATSLFVFGTHLRRRQYLLRNVDTFKCYSLLYWSFIRLDISQSAEPLKIHRTWLLFVSHRDRQLLESVLAHRR